VSPGHFHFSLRMVSAYGGPRRHHVRPRGMRPCPKLPFLEISDRDHARPLVYSPDFSCHTSLETHHRFYLLLRGDLGRACLLCDLPSGGTPACGSNAAFLAKRGALSPGPS